MNKIVFAISLMLASLNAAAVTCDVGCTVNRYDDLGSAYVTGTSCPSAQANAIRYCVDRRGKFVSPSTCVQLDRDKFSISGRCVSYDITEYFNKTVYANDEAAAARAGAEYCALFCYAKSNCQVRTQVGACRPF